MKKKTILIVAAVLLLISAAGGVALAFLTNLQTTPEIKEENSSENLSPTFFEIPPMLVNLNADSGARYLRIRILLEIESQAALPAAQAAMPKIIDELQTYLRQLTPNDLQGSTGTQRLQMELLDVIGKSDHHLIIKDVLIQEMLVQ